MVESQFFWRCLQRLLCLASVRASPSLPGVTPWGILGAPSGSLSAVSTVPYVLAVATCCIYLLSLLVNTSDMVTCGKPLSAERTVGLDDRSGSWTPVLPPVPKQGYPNLTVAYVAAGIAFTVL
jgi:hypothetical protein